MMRRLAAFMVLPLQCGLLLASCAAHAQQSAASPTGQGHHVSAAPASGISGSLRARIGPLLQSTWQGYRQDFIQGDGRVIDHGRQGVSTSEGESYALLRSVWMDDRPTFDLVWTWTHNNLQVRKDHLFGYLWGEHKDGTWSILSTNSASDADEDIALALVFAAHRWNDSTYLGRARAVIKDIWAHEVAMVDGRPVLTAGNWAPAVHTPGPPIDPSYFAPYAYRIFAAIDPAHPWMRLVDSSYLVLGRCTGAALGSKKSAGLPPDWCALTARGVAAKAPIDDKRSTWYGYDAFRVQWRIALDSLWNHDTRALQYLRSVSFLRSTWTKQHKLVSEYKHDGTPASRLEDPTVYGGDLGNFIVTAPSLATQIVQKKLLPAFQTQDGTAYWGQRYSYYEQNWVWFGLAMLAGALPDLAATSSI